MMKASPNGASFGGKSSGSLGGKAGGSSPFGSPTGGGGMLKTSGGAMFGKTGGSSSLGGTSMMGGVSGSKGGLGSMGSSSPMQKQSGFGSSSGGFGGASPAKGSSSSAFGSSPLGGGGMMKASPNGASFGGKSSGSLGGKAGGSSPFGSPTGGGGMLKTSGGAMFGKTGGSSSLGGTSMMGGVSGSKGGLGSMGSSSPMQKQSGFGSSSGGFGGSNSGAISYLNSVGNSRGSNASVGPRSSSRIGSPSTSVYGSSSSRSNISSNYDEPLSAAERREMEQKWTTVQREYSPSDSWDYSNESFMNDDVVRASSFYSRNTDRPILTGSDVSGLGAIDHNKNLAITRQNDIFATYSEDSSLGNQFNYRSGKDIGRKSSNSNSVFGDDFLQDRTNFVDLSPFPDSQRSSPQRSSIDYSQWQQSVEGSYDGYRGQSLIDYQVKRGPNTKTDTFSQNNSHQPHPGQSQYFTTAPKEIGSFSKPQYSQWGHVGQSLVDKQYKTPARSSLSSVSAMYNGGGRQSFADSTNTYMNSRYVDPQLRRYDDESDMYSGSSNTFNMNSRSDDPPQDSERRIHDDEFDSYYNDDFDNYY